MGRGMAANLLNKTFAGQQGVFTPSSTASKPTFVVYDPFAPALNDFLSTHTRAYAGRDVVPASSPAGVVRLASTVVTMLPSATEVEEVYLGENGFREGLEGLSDERREGTLFIDCTTGNRDHARGVAKEMEALGAAMVDAPVSGGVVGAEKGTLSFMVGGPEEAYVFARCVTAGNYSIGDVGARSQVQPRAAVPRKDGRAVHPLRRVGQRPVSTQCCLPSALPATD